MLTRIPYVVRSIDFLALRFSSNRQLLAIVRTMVCVLMLIGSVRGQTQEVDQAFIDRQLLVDYVDYFNRMEPETVQQAIPNAAAQAWLAENIPLFDCPQDNVREIYYFRWWSLRKHLRETPVGFAFTEFLVPRSYADKYNLISCALGHHVMETRWLRNRRSIDDCLHVWFRGNDGQPMARLHKFSSWAPYAVWQSISSMATRSLRSICYPTSSAKTNTGSVKTSDPTVCFGNTMSAMAWKNRSAAVAQKRTRAHYQ